MPARLNLGGVTVDVTFKDIKNVHLSVYPPTGQIRISAPNRLNLDTIRVYAISKLDWIKRQQKKFQEQDRETPREYLEHESHYLWGKRYLLVIRECNAPPSVVLWHNQMVLTVRSGTVTEKREVILAAWYREQVRQEATSLIAKWKEQLGVSVNHCFVQRMKTKWGSCNPHTRNIRLNTELAKKPLEYLEYIVVHEMTHLRVPNHDDRFVALMERCLPN